MPARRRFKSGAPRDLAIMVRTYPRAGFLAFFGILAAAGCAQWQHDPDLMASTLDEQLAAKWAAVVSEFTPEPLSDPPPSQGGARGGTTDAASTTAAQQSREN